MTEPIRFIPRATHDTQNNLAGFMELVRTRFTLLRACNRFEDNAWNIEGVGPKGGATRFLYFTQMGINPNQHFLNGSRGRGIAAEIPEERLLREPFRSFAKAMLVYLHIWETTSSLPNRIASFRYLEAALHEVNGSSNPIATTPEVLNRACGLVADAVAQGTSYVIARQLGIVYRHMVELGLVVPGEWIPPLRSPGRIRNRVGKEFDLARQKKLPSAHALEVLAAIFNSDSNDLKEIFASSVCALMLCAPDRSIEVLYAPLDILAPDWTDPDTGEVGVCLRWYPAKGAAPMTKTVIPSMRDIAVRAIDRLRRLSEPARALARWYEQHPGHIYLPPELEYLRDREYLNQNEIHAVLFGGDTTNLSPTQRQRVHSWLKRMTVPYVSHKGGALQGTSVSFSDLERRVLAMLPQGFPIMDVKTRMRYSEALCLARVGEFDTRASSPSQCCFDRIEYQILQKALRSDATVKSIFERRGLRDENGEFLSLTTHMLRHYLNTLVRQSSCLTEAEIAQWSGRKMVSQNATYNHQSDRDVIAKLRNAVGDPSKSVGPFNNIDNRAFIRRDEFASVKVITAHTTEFGYCVHDYAQLPCQVHQDCINCNEHVCIKGEARAEENLRKTQVELTRLQAEAQAAFSEEVLGAAEWFKYQSKTLARVNQLIAILDDPEVPQEAVIQLGGVVPPSRLAMAEESRRLLIKPFSQTITSFDEVCAVLTGVSGSPRETTDAN